jgi:hypothetical protein
MSEAPFFITDGYFFVLTATALCFLPCFLGCFLTATVECVAALDTGFVWAKAPKVNTENASSINTLIFFIIIYFIYIYDGIKDR